ncbi:unnamed protein product [Owenia fusiformis]|uniref:Uncharacterized protein n=1 Tax=Owenia fusiformis TaxID=6347 RepID=A0A8J1TWF7_OWEFU|nr:unnamed protein product [Owenia fusiformis]
MPDYCMEKTCGARETVHTITMGMEPVRKDESKDCTCMRRRRNALPHIFSGFDTSSIDSLIDTLIANWNLAMRNSDTNCAMDSSPRGSFNTKDMKQSLKECICDYGNGICDHSNGICDHSNLRQDAASLSPRMRRNAVHNLIEGMDPVSLVHLQDLWERRMEARDPKNNELDI